jgi:hypothetical protein
MAKFDMFGYRAEEIKSHSSLLTNERIDLILKQVDFWQMESWKKVCVPNVQAYFSSLVTLFTNVFVVFDPEDIESIVKDFNNFWNLYIKLQEEKEQNLKNVFTLLFICDAINRKIKAILQSFGYFFRKEEKTVKTIERALKVIEEGGGFFGGTKPQPIKPGAVQGVAQNPDKPK